MNDLEQQITQALQSQAQLAPALDLTRALAPHTAPRRTRLRRQGLFPLVAAAAVATLVVSISAVFTHDPVRPAGTEQALFIRPQPLNPALREISYHGVQFDVPNTFGLFNGYCGNARVNAVVTFPGVVSCSLEHELRSLSNVTEVGVTVLGPISNTLRAIATTQTTLRGKPVLRGTGKLSNDARPITVIVIPSIEVVLSVLSNNAELTERILSSVRYDTTDSYGCQAHLDNWHPTSQDTPDAERDRLVPGVPNVGTICVYRDEWLVHAVRIPTAELPKAVNVLNGLDPGISRNGISNTGGFGGASCEQAKHDGTIMHFGYANETSRRVWVRTSGCVGYSANNGIKRTQVSLELMQLIFRDGIYERVPPNLSLLRPMTDAEIHQFEKEQP